MKKIDANPNEIKAALLAFVKDIDDTGGVHASSTGDFVPAADPSWIDLGATYVKACKALRRQPVIGAYVA